MTNYIKELAASVNPNKPYVLVDIGAMGGIAQKWTDLLDYMQIVAFEPNKTEFKKLKNSDKVKYLNCLLVDNPRAVELFVGASAGVSSIFQPNANVVGCYPDVERFQIIEKLQFSEQQTKTLDQALKDAEINDVDFLKLDTQGSELGILQGGCDYVVPDVFGVSCEIEFVEVYKGQPLFRDVDAFMANNGFELVDLRRIYWKRKECTDYIGKGQLTFGEALYFRSVDSLIDRLRTIDTSAARENKFIKCILTTLIYKCFDYAMALTVQMTEQKLISFELSARLQKIIINGSRQGQIPQFPGRTFLYQVFNKLTHALRPVSFNGWADSDRMIGNIKDD